METFDHVIVGGGILGASTAYHLACKDAGSILVLERNELASAASSRAAGLILQASTKASKIPLVKLTTATIPILEEELGESVGFHNVGSLRIAASPERVVELDSMTNDALKLGIPIERPSTSELGEMVPWLDTNTILRSVFLPTDGYADPYILSMSYMRAAQSRGAIVRPRTHVRDILVDNQKVTGVVCDTGQIPCDNVIDACGAWAALFSERVGFPLPMAPVRSHYWMTEPDELYGGEHPVTILPDAAAYTRPEVGGLLLGVQEPNSATFNARELPDDPAAFSPTKGEEHWNVLTDSYDAVARFFPGIQDAKFSNYVCGLSSYTPDGEIILGPVPGVNGFYAAAGACGSGIALSAGIGDVISDLALGRTPAFDISSFRPDRFGQVDPFSEDFRQLCASARASKSKKLA